MRTPEDEQFETYLKGFQPIAPEPLPTIGVGRPSRRAFGIWIVAAAAIIVTGVILLQVRSNRVVVRNRSSDTATVEQLPPLAPLTMQSANAWLATAPSLKAAVDGLAFHPQPSPLPKGKQSAIAVLSKEKTRL